MHALLEQGYVEVDDVALDQRPVVGNAVADDLVHRRAQRLRIRGCAAPSRILQRARVGLHVDRGLMAGGIDLFGRRSGLTQLAEHGQGVGGITPGSAHALDDIGRLDPGLVPTLEDASVGPGRLGDRVRDRPQRRDFSWFHRRGGAFVTALEFLAATAPALFIRLRKYSHLIKSTPVWQVEHRRRANTRGPAAENNKTRADSATLAEFQATPPRNRSRGSAT